MKKKNLLLVVGGLFVAVAVGVMLAFVFAGDESIQKQDAVTMDLEGAWMVAAYVQAGNVMLPEGEFFVFREDTAYAYRNGENTPYATSSFELAPGSAYSDMDLKLPDIGRNYSVSVGSPNYIRLYESSEVYMELIRYANEDLSALSFDKDVVTGTWDVAYRNTGETIMEEKLHFENGTLQDYRNGSAEPSASAAYYWNEEGRICVDALGVEMQCFQLSEDVIFFVEVGTGYVWELHATD